MMNLLAATVLTTALFVPTSAWDRARYARQQRRLASRGVRGLKTGVDESYGAGGMPDKKSKPPEGMSKGSYASNSLPTSKSTKNSSEKGSPEYSKTSQSTKGSTSGSKSKGMGGGSGGEDCLTIEVQFSQSQVQDYYTEDQIGGGMIVSGING